MTSVLLFEQQTLPKSGVFLKQEEQNLSFKSSCVIRSGTKIKIVELLPRICTYSPLDAAR